MFDRPIPIVTKNLLILNGLFFLGTMVLSSQGINLSQYLALHYWGSEDFMPLQFVTYMFMHANFTHILFNMFAVWMFGSTIEQYWGPKRYMLYYFVTGIGAGLIQLLTIYIQIQNVVPHMSPDMIDLVQREGRDVIMRGMNYTNPLMASYNALLNSTIVGASGAVFGLLLAFGMMFPNVPLYLMFIPVPIKAKYMVLGYGLIELYSGLSNNPHDNVAHFAHLGGMLFGIVMILYWKKRGDFYKPW
jgi:membrane associated rhomboid family serine protease